MSATVVVDLSHYQPDPDWTKLKAAGILGVILKATEGTSYVDSTFKKRWTAARSHGFAAATYHFLQHGNPIGQMEHYLDTIQPVAGERVVVDFEKGDCSRDDLHAAVNALIGKGLEISVYGSPSFLKTKLGTAKDDFLALHTSLWIAQFNLSAAPSGWPTATWPTWSLWQWSDRGTIDGIRGPVDVNRFNGSNDACVRWLGPPLAHPATP